MVSPNTALGEYGERLQESVRVNLRSLVRLQSHLSTAYDDLVFSGTGPLQNEIQRWRDFEDSFLKPWPWTSRMRKPVDREMLAASKQSRERGEEGAAAKDLINRLKHCQ